MKNKPILSVILLVSSATLFAQETNNKVFHLDSLHYITTKTKYYYTRVVEDYNSKKNLYVVNEFYYPSGKISMSGTSKDKDNLKLDGLRTDYYENGNKKQESYYSDNKLSGKQISWYENNQVKSEKVMTWDAKKKETETNVLQFWTPEGTQTVIDGNGQMESTEEDYYEKGTILNGRKDGIWEGTNIKENYNYKEIYKRGSFISGISTDTDGNKFPYKSLFEKPEAKNGMMSFYQFIGKNYKTPNIQGLNGKVFVTFVVDKDGSLNNFKILRDVGYGTGEEAIRVLQKAEKWIPGKTKGIPTKVLFSLPISIQTSNSTNSSLNQGPSYESERARTTNR